MARCHRGGIDRNIERDLWGRSGGYCSNPECRASLIIETASGRAVTIGEMAHVIAWSPDGPRGTGNRQLDMSVDAAENLVLLCPNCHTTVDLAPGDFPVETLIQWREERTTLIRQVAAVPKFESRAELVAAISALLLENETIHRTYGPESDLASDPLSTGAATWRREAARVILPNNRRILELAEANSDLLVFADRAAVAEFRVHNDAFTFNQVSGEKDENAPMFPEMMTARFPHES